jgi:hypothetical protein
MVPRDFQFDSRFFDTLRAVIDPLKTKGGINQRGQIQTINKLAQKHTDSSGQQLKLSAGQYTSFKRGGKLRQWEIMNFMWSWLHAEHHQRLQDAWDAQAGLAPSNINKLSSAVHEFLLGDVSFDASCTTLLSGSWVSFRPYFLDPAQVMVSSVEFGVDGDPALFKMTSSINRGVETIRGSVVPYERSVLLVAKIDGSNAPFVMILTNLIVDATAADTKRYCEAEGVCLAGASGKLPSAYPIALHRPHETIKPACHEMAEFIEAFPEDRYHGVTRVLARGFTEWR